MYYQKTSILQLKCDQKYKIYTDYKVVPWIYQAELEILRWCWKVKKVVQRHSKMGHGEHCSRYLFLKLPKQSR